MGLFDDSDEEDPWEDEMQNDAPPSGIDSSFSTQVQNTKHALYNCTIYSVPADDPSAQDNTHLRDYLKYIDKVYLMAITCQNGKRNTTDVSGFPLEAQEPIRSMLEWIESFFSTHTVPDIIDYQHYIYDHFHVHPTYQNKSFIE